MNPATDDVPPLDGDEIDRVVPGAGDVATLDEDVAALVHLERLLRTSVVDDRTGADDRRVADEHCGAGIEVEDIAPA